MDQKIYIGILTLPLTNDMMDKLDTNQALEAFRQTTGLEKNEVYFRSSYIDKNY